MSKHNNFFKNLQDFAAKAEDTVKKASEQLNTVAGQAYENVAPAVDKATQNVVDAASQIYEKLAPAVDKATQNVTDFAEQAYTVSEEKVKEAAEFLKTHAPSFDNAPQALSLDDIGRKIASLGVPAIAFAVAASIAGGMGLAGGAVVTTALAMLGGPAGMLGGLVALGILTLIADAVGKYGIETVLLTTFRARRDQGILIEQIHSEIDGLWISHELKYTLKIQLATPQS